MGDPLNLAGSAAEIRSVFGIMGHNDRSSVALIGGGHAIGKSHGACQGAPGLSPMEAFEQKKSIWKGSCGNGKGVNTFTSGFEGHWTSQPQKWDNEFFKDLVGKKWVLDSSPAGQGQYVMEEAEKDTYNRIRLATDMALLHDEEYKKIVEEFAEPTNGQTKLNGAFDAAWDALTTTKHTGQWSSEASCDDGSTAPTSVITMRDDDVNISNMSDDMDISNGSNMSDDVDISNSSNMSDDVDISNMSNMSDDVDISNSSNMSDVDIPNMTDDDVNVSNMSEDLNASLQNETATN